MICPTCQFENEADAKFCNKCGSKLEIICVECGIANRHGSQFCKECGYDLTKPPKPSSIDYSKPQSYTPKFLADKILTTRSTMEGERKLVTVLFADVANYTAMAEKLDPEEVHQIMDECFKILMDEIHKYEGTINQFTGDGVMALFGAPVTHEDHAKRACHAALLIQKALNSFRERLKQDFGVEFMMRIGLNSGPVIVGSIGHDLRMDYTAIGDTTNLAARIQQTAKPGEIYISQETRNLIQDYFQIDPVGEIPLKGKAELQSLYCLIAERRGVRTRFEAGLAQGVTELVGRHDEMETLLAQVKRANNGEAQIVDVVGVAGVGKSRLVYELQKALGDQVTFLTGVCIQYGGNINFLPMIDVVKASFGIEEEMNEEEAGNRIEMKATGSRTPMIPFYRNLLSYKVDDPVFNNLQPDGRKFGMFEAVKDLLLALTQEKTLVLFLEDVHWIDKISEEFFAYFSRCIPEYPILMLTAYRPECTPPWAKSSYYHRLHLESLGSKYSIHLVHNKLGGLALDSELEQKIVEKTGGNPFFIEEIVQELRDRGEIVKAGDRFICNRPIDQLQIPGTVQTVLAARMDRLNDELKRTMQVASVIGRDFAFRILKSITELGDELRDLLKKLVGLEILYEKALYPELEYIFKHALTQEVAYDSILKQRRKAIHVRIARTIEELYNDRIEEYCELLVHQYERSGYAKKEI
ncbi:MAG: AAA family ATPase [Desulfobacteraceae bacterium]|nr:MAG: AAA family ATPase [Desulfobacteraceae bacterium]